MDGIPEHKLAVSVGVRVPRQRINGITYGKRVITVDTAWRVAKYADTPAEIRANLRCHDGPDRAEAGCLHFDVEPTADPLVWRVSERFVDQAAFDAHQARVRSSEWGLATAGIRRDYVIEAAADDA